MLDHKTSLNKYKKIEIISSIFSDSSGMKLEINYRRKTGKFTNMWRLNNMLLNKQLVKEDIKREVKKYLETNENEMQHNKIMAYSKSDSKREVYSDKCLH